MSTSITVQCPNCGLRLVDSNPPHPDVVYNRDGNGNVLCPNDEGVMLPVGDSTVTTAEEAFKQANRELAADVAPAGPAAETTETLTKRLREIELARGRVIDAQSRFESKRDAAKEAKKHLDDETETFLTIVGRLSAVPSVLPLFSQEAEAAAAGADARYNDPKVLLDALELFNALVDAGLIAVRQQDVDDWNDAQRAEARAWLTDPTEERLPAFLRTLTSEGQDESATETETATTTA